jgi:hypothetical protein
MFKQDNKRIYVIKKSYDINQQTLVFYGILWYFMVFYGILHEDVHESGLIQYCPILEGLLLVGT